MKGVVMAAEPDFTFPAVWTEDDLATLPEDGHRYEIVDGSLIMTSPASYYHQSIGRNLLRILFRQEPPTGWDIQYELGLRVNGGNLVPDIVVLYDGERTPGLWQDCHLAALVVEIASTSTQAFDAGVKLQRYAASGIPIYWRIDGDGTLTVHTDPVNGVYQSTETVKPGRLWQTDQPFHIRFDPDDLIP